MKLSGKKRGLQIFVIVGLMAVFAYAKSTGPDQGYTGAPGDLGDCTAWHDRCGFANVGPGGVEIGQNPVVYQPGQTYTLTVTVHDPHAKRWGFEMTALDSS